MSFCKVCTCSKKIVFERRLSCPDNCPSCGRKLIDFFIYNENDPRVEKLMRGNAIAETSEKMKAAVLTESGSCKKKYVLKLNNGKEIEIPEEGGIVGRAELGAEEFADFPSVSRQHLRVTPQQNGGVLIEDISTHGTFVNGLRIVKNSRFRVVEGSKITLCNVDAVLTVKEAHASIDNGKDYARVLRFRDDDQKSSKDDTKKNIQTDSTKQVEITRLTEEAVTKKKQDEFASGEKEEDSLSDRKTTEISGVNYKNTKKKELHKKSVGKFFGRLAVFVLLAGILFYGVWWHIIPYVRYQKACKAIENQEFDDAYNTFVDLDNYRDSKDKATDVIYQKGVFLKNSGLYTDAIAEFERIPGYKDSKEQLEYCWNEQAVLDVETYFESSEYEDVTEAFAALTEYYGSEEEAKSCVYLYAQRMINSENYKKAVEAMELISDYKDVAEFLPEIKYQYAQVLSEEKDWETASALFQQLGNYRDSATRYIESYYQYGLSLLDNNSYVDAITVFTALGSYEESNNKLIEAKYGYVLKNQRYYDKTTYSYLKELIEIGYKDSSDIYDTLYAWQVTISITESEFDSTSLKTINKNHDCYFNAWTKGGAPVEPENEINLYILFIFPSGRRVYLTDNEMTSNHGVSINLNQFGLSSDSTGSLKVKVYNDSTDELVCECTVNVTDR